MFQTCIRCGARASVMRREYLDAGAVPGFHPVTKEPIGPIAQAKPGAARWYCARHAPARVTPDSEFKEQR